LISVICPLENTAANNSTVIEAMAAIAGADYVLTDERNCSYYSQDIYTRALPALAVVRPGSTADVARVAAAATQRGHAVVTRGGGMSYTGGYVPAEADTILIDMGRLNRVVECNTEDMYVTMEAACTWKDLHAALRGTGCRTPYWGTLSGIKATVGGSLSQNSIFWGSGRYGSAADSVLSLEVALADGTILDTGSNAQKHGAPFFRHYGPDLTGLFCCDAGALGIKTKATLQLVPELAARRFASFDFDHYGPMTSAMSAIAREGLAMECFGFDPFLQKQRMQRDSLLRDVKALAGVMKASNGVVAAVTEGVKTAVAGRGFMEDVAYSLHIVVEEASETLADDRMDRIRQICSSLQGREIENSIPKILRANPFAPLNNVVGPQGERWAPVHALIPHSRAIAVINGAEKIFSGQRELMEREGIGAGFLFATVSTNCFVVEPVFFWPDAMTEIHRDTVEPGVLKKLPGFDENPEARRAVALIRQELLAFFRDMGAAHLQVGKAYLYKEGLKSPSWELVRQLKSILDPDNRINPGALGL